LSRNKEDPEYFLLMEAIRFKLLTRGFSGDDMFQGWPQYLERMGVGLLGYEKFCKKIGLLFKYCTISQLYADVFYESKNGIWIETSRTDGVVF